MNILVLMAGESKPFEDQGYQYPKYLIEIAGKPLVQHVIENLTVRGKTRYIFIIRKEDVDRYHFNNVLHLLIPNSEIIIAEGMTKGAACTALLAIESIDNNEPLLIANGDVIVEVDFGKVIKDFHDRHLDGGILTFDSVHPRWSYVRLDNNDMVVEAAEKRPISRHATTGHYYFLEGRSFVEAAMEMIRKDAHVNDSFYVCPSYNELILQQAKIGTYNIPRDAYFSLATPQGVQIYEDFLKSSTFKGKDEDSKT
jgi:NDP-sugar pyrophosphorylase family protein